MSHSRTTETTQAAAEPKAPSSSQVQASSLRFFTADDFNVGVAAPQEQAVKATPSLGRCTE